MEFRKHSSLFGVVLGYNQLSDSVRGSSWTDFPDTVMFLLAKSMYMYHFDGLHLMPVDILAGISFWFGKLRLSAFLAVSVFLNGWSG
jgi:hypothetical protein